jgi:O-antigen ligase
MAKPASLESTQNVSSMPRSRPTLGAYLVGIYLFSVPAFAYAESSRLLLIPQITGALLVAYAILDVLRNKSLKIPREIQFYGFMGLWAAVTFGFTVSGSDWGTLSLGTLIKVVIASLACAQLIKSDSDFFAALKIFSFSILLVYIQNRDDLQYLRIADQVTEEDRFAGTLANANAAAMFSLTVIWASLLLWLRSKRGLSRKIWYLIPIGISLLIIYYSGSKKGLFGIGLFVLFFGRLLYMRARRSPYKKALVVLVSASLIFISGYYIYTSPFFIRIELFFSGTSGSDINRWTLAGEAIHVWLMNVKTFIMGVGYNNFKLFSDLQSYSHSTLLELLASNGIVGFSLFGAFFFLLCRKFVFLYRQAADRESKSLFFSCLIFLSLFAFFMLAAVLHDSRELLPILSGLAAYGQWHVRVLRQTQSDVPSGSGR